MINTLTVSAALSLALASAGYAQPAKPGGGDPVTQSVRASWDSVKNYMIQSAEVMPDDKFAFKPVDGVRTFGQVLAHVAGANYIFCSAAKGEKSPHAEDEFEKSATTKPAITKALKDSIAYCDSALASANDTWLAEMVDMPFGMPRGARAGALIDNIGHVNEHYGNLVTYFRINKIVPPSSRR